jgi:hypothetical protein
MIEILEMAAPHAIGLKITGKIEKEDIDKVFSLVDQKLNQVERLAVYVEVEKMGGISVEALIEDIKKALPNFKRYAKKAVVSSSKWHKLFSEVGDKLFPSLEVRHFEPEQKEEALAWVNEEQ